MSALLPEPLSALILSPESGADAISDELMALARRHRLHLVIADRIALPALIDERRAAAAIEGLRETELRRVLAALAGAGIRVVLFKGAAIARTHYRAPELRPRSDTDVLVPADRSQAVAGVLEQLGYRRAVETEGELIASQFHCEFVDRAGLTHALDVHWRISNVIAFGHTLSIEEIADQATALPGLGPSALGPCPVHSLLLACVHRIAHHPDSADQLWLYDVHLLVNRLSADEQQQFIALATERRVRAVCAYTLTDAFNVFAGAAGELADRMTPPAGTVEPTAVFLTAGRRPVDMLTTDLKTLGGWAPRLQLLREHFFPRRDYMFARYGTQRAWSLPWLYLRRIVVGAPKWLRW